MNDDKDIEELFKRATHYVRSHAGELESNELLYFYSRYKQGIEGRCNVSKPSFFDFQGKQKWEAWHLLGDMSKTTAMLEYISQLSSINSSWNNEILDRNEQGGLGVSVSTLQKEDMDIADENKTVFDYCKEGNLRKFETLLHSIDMNTVDEEGMGLIHWATDRGSYDIVKLLVEKKADINLKDAENQTALHYAASCGHESIAEFLLKNKIDKCIADLDGNTAFDIADDDHIKQLLNSD